MTEMRKREETTPTIIPGSIAKDRVLTCDTGTATVPFPITRDCKESGAHKFVSIPAYSTCIVCNVLESSDKL